MYKEPVQPDLENRKFLKAGFFCTLLENTGFWSLGTCWNFLQIDVMNLSGFIPEPQGLGH